MSEKEKVHMKASDLRNIRTKRLDISQAAFAKHIGVSKSTYCFWEQGVNPISEWAANLIRLTADKLENDK